MLFSDVHLGNKLSAVKHFKSNLIERYRNDPDAWFIDLGDCCDMVVAQGGDRRYQADMIDPSYVGLPNPVDRMIDDYCELVWPIKDRIICLADSNHHLSIEQRTGTSPTRRIAYNLWGKEADNRMLGYAGFLVTRFISIRNGPYYIVPFARPDQFEQLERVPLFDPRQSLCFRFCALVGGMLVRRESSLFTPDQPILIHGFLPPFLLPEIPQ